jgi:hypothetical protein
MFVSKLNADVLAKADRLLIAGCDTEVFVADSALKPPGTNHFRFYPKEAVQFSKKPVALFKGAYCHTFTIEVYLHEPLKNMVSSRLEIRWCFLCSGLTELSLTTNKDISPVHDVSVTLDSIKAKVTSKSEKKLLQNEKFQSKWFSWSLFQEQFASLKWILQRSPFLANLTVLKCEESGKESVSPVSS